MRVTDHRLLGKVRGPPGLSHLSVSVSAATEGGLGRGVPSAPGSSACHSSPRGACSPRQGSLVSFLPSFAVRLCAHDMCVPLFFALEVGYSSSAVRDRDAQCSQVRGEETRVPEVITWLQVTPHCRSRTLIVSPSDSNFS